MKKINFLIHLIYLTFFSSANTGADNISSVNDLLDKFSNSSYEKIIMEIEDFGIEQYRASCIPGIKFYYFGPYYPEEFIRFTFYFYEENNEKAKVLSDNLDNLNEVFISKKYLSDKEFKSCFFEEVIKLTHSSNEIVEILTSERQKKYWLRPEVLEKLKYKTNLGIGQASQNVFRFLMIKGTSLIIREVGIKEGVIFFDDTSLYNDASRVVDTHN